MKIIYTMIICISISNAGKITRKQFNYLSELSYILKISDFCLKTSNAREFLKRDNFKFLDIKINAGSYGFKGSVYELNKICDKSKI